MKNTFSKEVTGKIPEKLTVTSGEKTAEIICGIVTAMLTVVLLVLLLGKISGEAILVLVCLPIFYGVMTLASLVPQHANVFYRPENHSESEFHRARKGYIIAKLVICPIIFIIAIFKYYGI